MTTSLSLGLSGWLLGFAGMGLLCLTSHRHARQLSPPLRQQPWQNLFALAGWLLVLLALWCSILNMGWGFGPLLLLGQLCVVSLAVVALLSYRPRWLLASVLIAGLSGPLLFLVGRIFAGA